MAKAMCIQCGVELASNDVLQQHKQAGHPGEGPLAGESIAPPNVPLPDPEFIKRLEEMEARKQAAAEIQANPPELKMPELKPIHLTYVYAGECPTCRTPINTLELDLKVGGVPTHVLVAVCPNCKAQLDSREEKKL